MKAFLIAKNGKRQCLAGVGSSGVLTAIATWVKSPRKPKSERTWLTVGVGTAAKVLQQVGEAVANWPDFAARTGVSHRGDRTDS